MSASVFVEQFPELNRRAFERNGFLVVNKLCVPDCLPQLHNAFDALFNGDYETGVAPDEVNWQFGTGAADRTRQICNGWKANRAVAAVVLDDRLGRAIAQLAGWPGVRIMIDNVLWKPSTAKSLGYHQDSAFLSWFTPSDLITCWIALDDTSRIGGTLEFAVGSHQWPLHDPIGEFHAPVDHRASVTGAAKVQGLEPEFAYVEVPAGGGSFHHGWLWHGSGQNNSQTPRRALVLHAMRCDVEYCPQNFSRGIGPIYSRYKRLADNTLDENYFPILWREDGYRTPAIDQYLRNVG